MLTIKGSLFAVLKLIVAKSSKSYLINGIVSAEKSKSLSVHCCKAIATAEWSSVSGDIKKAITANTLARCLFGRFEHRMNRICWRKPHL
ncbi:hypothetical protein L596_016941 [Steinernema carpocapsae]|uniref:Uncharacterized protein n=1 Tax=Steinernema carpocapsae TaxID=34508 RepID=A0A4U5MZR2_STECR|nr:hypothetical protein L596_016941 [Steinernema carpocapsae]